MKPLALWVLIAAMGMGVVAGHAQGTFFKNRAPLGPEPVSRLEDLPTASWNDLAAYAAQKVGFDRLAAGALDEWFSYSNCDQFQKDRLNPQQMASHRETTKSAVIGRAVPTRLRLPVSISLGTFDASRQGLNVAALRRGGTVARVSGDMACRSARAMQGLNQLPANMEIQLGEDAPWYPAISGDSAFADKILKEAGGQGLKGELVVDLTSGLEARAPTELPYRVIARPVALFLFLDEDRTKFVAALGRAAPGSEQRRPPPPSPQPKESTAAPAPAVTSASSSTSPAAAPAASPLPDGIEGRVENVVDTGTLLVGGQQVPLFGIVGLGSPYDSALMKIIRDQGGVAKCSRRGDRYLCKVGEYDVALIALYNGGARAAADAPQEYLDGQARAAAQQLGIHRR
jgi:hypothetical protein